METERKDTKKTPWWPLISLIVIVTLACGLNWLFLYRDSTRGTFGDMFGVASTLFSGLAFAGIIYAIILQRKELQLQRLELRDTREELKGQRKQLEAQAKTQRIQQFESTYFQMLRMLSDRADQMAFGERTTTPTIGRRCFQQWYELYLKKTLVRVASGKPKAFENDATKAFKSIGDWFDNMLSPYFLQLYHILDFIHESTPGNKYFFMSLLSAQMTIYEKLLLFYYALSKYAPDMLKYYIKYYRLLERIPKDQLANPNHYSLYDGFKMFPVRAISDEMD